MLETKINVDWISATMRPALTGSDEEERRKQRKGWIALELSRRGVYVLFDRGWIEHARRPYNKAYRAPQHGCTLFFNDKLDYQTIEFTGKGCAELTKRKELSATMAYFIEEHNVTRFDIAVDIRTDLLPRDFIAAGYSSRIKSHSEVVSPSGQTYYLGSPKSDLSVRVYRYESPHPRHEFLRIEFQARRDRAKQLARIWLSAGPIAAAKHAAASFAFAHPDWQENIGHGLHEPLPAIDRGESKTMEWLIKQVKPAMLRLLESGEVSNSWWNSFFEGMPLARFAQGVESDENESPPPTNETPEQ